MVKPASDRKDKYLTKRDGMTGQYVVMLKRPGLKVDVMANRADIDATIARILNMHKVAKTTRIRYYNFARYLLKRKDILTPEIVEKAKEFWMAFEECDEKVLDDLVNGLNLLTPSA
jgi:CRISPR/Cas system endoribonuclease Cas6 (RAMP superfamily)